MTGSTAGRARPTIGAGDEGGDRGGSLISLILSTVLVLAVLGGTLAYWASCFRYHLLQGDDYLNAAMAGHPGGQLDLGEWWAAYVHDYTQVNGRLADSVVRIFMALGHRSWKATGPVLFTAIAGVTFLWGLQGRAAAARAAGRRLRLAPWSALLLVAPPVMALPLLLQQIPIIGGEALFWMSATVTYVLPTLAVLLAGLGLARLVTGPARGPARGPVEDPAATRRPGRLLWAVGVGLLIAFAHLMQEESSFAMAALVAATWLVARGHRRDRVLWAWTVTSLVGLCIQTFAPGIWSRFALSTGSSASGRSGTELIRGLGNATEMIGWAMEPAFQAMGVVVLLAGIVAVFGGAPRLPLWRRWALLGCGAAILGAGYKLIQVTWHRLGMGWQRFDPGTFDAGKPGLDAKIHLAQVTTAAALVVLAAILLAAWLARPEAGPGAWLLSAAMLGSLVPALGVGVGTPRSYVMPYLFLVAAMVAMAGHLAIPAAGGEVTTAPAATGPRHTGRGVAIALHVLGLLGLLAMTAVGAQRTATVAPLIPEHLRANAAAWAPTQKAIAKAQAGQCTGVPLPVKFPYEPYMYDNAFWEKQYAADLKLYYDLPGDARFTWNGEGDCGS